MDTTAWIILAVVAAIVIVGVAFALTRGRERRLETRREEAGVLRERAHVRAEQAQQHEAVAEEKAREARREREAAEATAQRADEVDPDVEQER
jgi:flagellar biosynthesis/type III secretory pathway M-ring protein FliF/YscJ